MDFFVLLAALRRKKGKQSWNKSTKRPNSFEKPHEQVDEKTIFLKMKTNTNVSN